MIRTALIEGDRNGDTLEVLEDYEECGIRVPAGFRSDGISVPRFLWRLLSPKITPESVTAGVLHDYAYRAMRQTVSRADADLMFYHLLRKYGFGWLRSGLAWLGVRLFGWIPWRVNELHMCCGCKMECKKCYRWTGRHTDE